MNEYTEKIYERPTSFQQLRDQVLLHEQQIGNLFISFSELKREQLVPIKEKVDKVYDRVTFWGGAIFVASWGVPLLIQIYFSKS